MLLSMVVPQPKRILEQCRTAAAILADVVTAAASGSCGGQRSQRRRQKLKSEGWGSQIEWTRLAERSVWVTFNSNQPLGLLSNPVPSNCGRFVEGHFCYYYYFIICRNQGLLLVSVIWLADVLYNNYP